MEEAAEVLEAHVLASLNASTQQLLLIGDHQQLRPSVACHELTLPRYSLSVSLFERALKPMPLVSRMLPRCRDLVSRRTVRLVGRCRLTFLHAPDSSVLFGRPIGHRRRRRGR